MSKQPELSEQIDRLAENVQEWLSLSRCPEWLWRYPFFTYVDPRKIIASQEGNQDTKRFTNDPSEAEEIKLRWDKYYRRALSVENALSEHGQAVGVELARRGIPDADALALFLRYRTPEYAERVLPMLTVARVRVLVEAKPGLKTPEPKPAAESNEPPGEQPGIEQHMQRLTQAVGDDNTCRIMAIAHRPDLSGEGKMEEIIRIDSRFAGKTSPEWATLLGVSPAAVRGYALWKRLQEAKKADW